MKRRNPRHVHSYKIGTAEEWRGSYLRRPGHKKVRLRVPEEVLTWSPSFAAAYEAAMAELPARPRSALTAPSLAPSMRRWSVTTAQPPSMGLPKSTQASRRAILERFRNDHGDKRVALMHADALQNILNGKSAIVQRNWRKALRGFIDHCLTLGMMKIDPLSGVKLAKTKKTGGIPYLVRGRDRHVQGTPCTGDHGEAGVATAAADRARQIRRRSHGQPVRQERQAVDETEKDRRRV